MQPARNRPAPATSGPIRRLGVVALTVALGVGGASLMPSFGSGPEFPEATPAAVACGPDAAPETGLQGRVSSAEFASGRAAEGYRCNTREVARQGSTGGFKVQRYVDRHGNVCAYYDSTTLFPKDVLFNAVTGLGVIVVDMNDAANPRQTATLVTPAMLSPHESLLVNEERGLLGAVMGSPLTQVGLVDLYDISEDCRRPRWLSTSPTGVLGHESGWSPDGNTFYSAGAAGTLTAIDVSNPRLPRTIFTQFGVVYHGLRLSEDGRTMYVTNMADPSGRVQPGLRILDVSEIQDRRPNPKVSVISDLSWREVSIPQVAEPFERDGRQYLLETDEYAGQFSEILTPGAVPGAARIIDITDPRRPRVVSDLRLAVHQPENRTAEVMADPGARIPVQGYAAHYCSVPTQRNPTLVACSMILSGLRIFDISDLAHPREVAYFNQPTAPGEKLNYPIGGGFAMSQPAWDLERNQVWYTDANQGLFVVELTGGVRQGAAPTRAVPARLRYRPTSRPRVRGQARVGRRLGARHVRPAHFTPRPSRLRYQWLRDGQAIRGATRPRYRVRAADRGTRLRVRITAVRPDHRPARVSTRPVRVR